MHSYDTQILVLIDLLKSLGTIRFDTDFCAEVGITKQHLNNIKRQKKQSENVIQNYHFTAEHIQKICQIYNVDANWIYGFTSKPFRQKLTISKQN